MAKRDDPKQEMRDRVRRTLRRQEDEERLAASSEVVLRLVSSPIWSAAETVFAFVSLPDEVETTELCARALTEGKSLGLPRFGEDGLVFYQVTDLDALRVDNSMAIRQPSRDLPELSSTQNPRQPGRLLIVAPGRAFTSEGARLGRGGGFYDAFFSALRRRNIVFQAIGVAFDEQLMGELPSNDKDEPVHGVVIPNGSFGVIE